MVAHRIIPRARLSKILDQGKSVWIWGIAGAGKSTLVHSHCDREHRHVKTHHLDHSDVDPVCLFSRIAALFPRTLAVQLTYPGLQSADPVVYSRHFWSQLWELAEPSTALVLEDQHELGQDPVALAILREAIAAIPPTLGQQLVVTSREPVPAELSELVLSRKLEVIGDAELRLTEEEAQALTSTRMAGAPSSLRAAIYRRSLGWTACHERLIAHVSTGGTLDDVPDEAPPQGLYDYLTREVISKLASVERFTLVATALLARATPSMIVRVSGEPRSSTALSQLLQQGLLEVAVAEMGVQAHPLLAAVSCQVALEELGPDAWLQLVARAATALSEEGRFDEAVRLATRYGLHSLACHWVKDRAWTIVSSGRAHTLRSWLMALPPTLLHADLQLCFWHHVSSNSTAQRLDKLHDVYRQLVSARNWLGAYSAWTWIANEVATGMETLLTAAWLDELHSLQSLAPCPNDPLLELHFERSVGLARIVGEKATLDFSRARELIHMLARAPANPAAICNLLWKAHYELGIAPAAQLLLDVRAALQQHRNEALAALTLAMSESLVAVANGQHAESIEQAMRAIGICEELGMPQLAANAWTLVVCAALAAGDPARAANAAERLASLPSDGSRFGGINRHFAIGLSDLRQSKLRSAASHMARAAELADAIGCVVARCHLFTGEAQISMATLGLQEARRLVEDALTRCERNKLPGLHPTLQLLTAHIARRAGDVERAKQHAAQALAAARSAGGLIPALDPRLLAETFGFALEHEIDPESVRWLVRTLRLDAPAGAGPRWPWRLEVRALGGLTLSREGEALPVPNGKARELLCALVALGARDVPLAVLGDMLWPDADGDAVRRAFDTTLHRLRQHPSLHGLLELKAGRLSLQRAHVWVDVEAVREAATRGAGKRPVQGELLTNANREELLDMELDYPWLAAARSELRARVARAVGRSADL
jgi:LuxR family transcriptional regulator, maltose regulon positive regulatory protein